MIPGLPAPLPRLRRAPARVASAVVLALMAWAALPAPAPAQDGECLDVPSDPGICLVEDRFKVTVEWKDFSGNPFTLPGNADEGPAQGIVVPPSTPTAVTDTGYFWFFSPDNIELVVKMIDGRDTNGAFWFFTGSLSDVEYRVRVVDTQTQAEATYENPPGAFINIRDTQAFPEEAPKSGALAQTGSSSAFETGFALERRAVILPAGSLPSCDDPGVACVHGGRFAVQTVFDPGMGAPAHQGAPVLITGPSVLFEHLPSQGVDTAVKVLDGRGVNDSFWVFASAFALNDVTVHVTDLETGKAASYASAPAKDLVVADRQPFAPDPPDGPWLESAELPGFRFKVRVTAGGAEIATRQEADCIPETLCISGAVPGRSELFLRIVGPKPNGFLQPNVVKFSTSQIEVWIEQLATGLVNYYLLDGATPGSTDLTGFFDRFGFGPGP